MSNGITVGGIVKISIVTAFTIAAALIWKDLFSETIQKFYPQDVLFYQFIGAIVATIFVVLTIYIVLKTESRTETILKGWKKN